MNTLEEALNELEKATKELGYQVAKNLGFYKLLNWLAKITKADNQ